MTRKKYLDETQDEAYFRSSLHGDAAVEAESRIPAQPIPAMPARGQKRAAAAPLQLSLSGSWRMKGAEPADPGHPAPGTGWFGRRQKDSPGMIEKWQMPGFDRSGWHEVTVPTTVQRALIELGELADPDWNTNTIDELEEHGEPKETPVWFRRTRVEQQDWWFARTFEVPGDWQGKPLTLIFDGIDYSGTVFLNGASLGHHKGMFGGPMLDVTGLIRYDGPNELVVRIDQAPQSWNGLLKGSPSFGWHYGHLISQGIWKDVRITAEPQTAIADPYVATQSIDGNEAVLAIEYTLKCLSAGQQAVTMEGEIRRKDGAGETVQFRNEAIAGYGRNRFRTEVRLVNPSLWWPLGYGEPSLYELSLSVSADGEAAASDSVSAVFGIRTIEMREMEDAPETDYRWQFVINGVPMFIKGANWCWTDPLLEQQKEKYERMLELARRGNVQMLRAWGGGIVEDDAFYELCDEKGIMVYQEFPLCWGPIDSPFSDLGVIDRQVAHSVKRLRNHPSLVMWGGGNENGGHGGADEGLFLVGRRCRLLDPSRPFHRTDPWGGSVHNWNVYHGGEPLDEATLAMPSVFYGEYGIPSMTNASSVPRYMPEGAVAEWPPTEDSRGWKAHFHQFSLKDVIKVMRYGAFGPIRSWEQYIEYSQTAQGESVRFTADVQRAGAGRTKSGFWYYKFSDLFPGHSWAVVDSYGTPKLSYYRAMQVCRPRSAFLAYERMDGWKAGESFQAGMHAANDTLEPLTGASVTAAIYSSSLAKLWNKTYESLTLEANTTILLEQVSLELPSDEEIKPFLAAITLRAADGMLISDQWYWFNAQPKTEELLAFERSHVHNGNEYPGEEAVKAFALYAGLEEAPLHSLPRTELECRIERDGSHGTIRVRNSGDVPAVRVIVDGFPDSWDCYLADNDFGLYPGEERDITFEAASGSPLSGLNVRAWNAPRVIPAQLTGGVQA